MRYIIHDTTNGGTDNGISRSAISNFTEQVAEELGLDYQDYNLYDIVHELNNDSELMQLAQEIYTPFPVLKGWTDEYKAITKKPLMNAQLRVLPTFLTNLFTEKFAPSLNS